MKAQFYLISAAVIITFLLFASLFISHNPSPASAFYSNNDVFLASNLLLEAQHLIETGNFVNVSSFVNYSDAKLSEMGYDLKSIYGYSPISGETNLDLDYSGQSQKGTRTVAETNYICNNFNRTVTFDFYWNACMLETQASAVSDRECNVTLHPFECYESNLLKKVPGNRDLIVFTAKNESNKEVMNICMYTGTGNLTYSQNITFGVYLELNLTSSDSDIFVNSLYRTPYCLNHCPKEDVTSCG
ncbi:MAG: hypothetical protein QXO69_00185 [archaeon]